MTLRQRFTRDGTRRRALHDPARAVYGLPVTDPRTMINRGTPIPPPTPPTCAFFAKQTFRIDDGVELTPYASYSDAATAGSDYVADCLMFDFLAAGHSPTTKTASNPTSTQLIGYQAVTGYSQRFWFSLRVASGTDLTFSWSGSAAPDTASVNYAHYSGVTGNELGFVSTSGDAGSGTILGLSAGTYIFFFTFGFGINNSTCTLTVDSSLDMVVNPIIIAWDDSGTTRSLWACPKLMIPPTGPWYANSSDAATAISTLTSNCVGYIESLTNITTFTATDGGTSLTLAVVLTAGATSEPVMWGGVNAVDGETITITATAGAGTPSLSASIYDDTGGLVEASGVVASPWTSSTLPYKGRYTIKVTTTSTLSTVALAAAITSSGTLSVNPIQALYDVGLDCPARLDC